MAVHLQRKKSAIMIFGESKRDHDRGAKYRNFLLNGDKVPERVEYDHVGIKNCLFNNAMPRTEERISSILLQRSKKGN